MNRFVTFKTKPTVYLAFLTLFISLCISFNLSIAQNNTDTLGSINKPALERGGSIHADIDFQNNLIYVTISDGMWSYNIKEKRWSYVSSLKELSKPLDDLESGLDPINQVFYFWDKGVGSVYKYDLKNKSLVRIDNSHSHRNQFTHQPFIKDGTIFAFGGYGYWSWKNYITYYNPSTREWNLENVAPTSIPPRARTVKTGAYLSSKNEFFMFGGRAPKNETRADDQYTERSNLKDIWKFSFDSKKWQKVGEIDSEYEYYGKSKYKPYERINRISSSFHSDQSNIWYIPVIKGGIRDYVNLLPINTLTGDIFSPLSLVKYYLNSFIPSNFLIDQNSSNIYLVGLERITDGESYPIKIIEIPEDSLLKKLDYSFTESDMRIYLYAGFGLLVIYIGFLYYIKSGAKTEKDNGYTKLESNEIGKLNWLKDEEKRLIRKLLKEKSLLESEELEDSVWSDIDNYDYRRKLRNETINGINKKFKKNFDTTRDLVLRVKDPNDQRRYLYKLNEDYIA